MILRVWWNELCMCTLVCACIHIHREYGRQTDGRAGSDGVGVDSISIRMALRVCMYMCVCCRLLRMLFISSSPHFW